MMLWRTPRLICRAFTSETTQDWVTNSMFMASPDTGTNKGLGFASHRASFDSPRQSMEEALSVVDGANRRSTDTSFHSMDIQRPMSPTNETVTLGLADALMNSNDKEQRSTPNRSESEDVSTPGRDRGEKGSNVDHNQDPTLNLEQETPEPRVSDMEQSSIGGMQNVALSRRTLKTKKGISDLANARDRVVNGNHMELGELATQTGASTLPKTSDMLQNPFPQSGESVDSANDEYRVSQVMGDAIPRKSGPLHFRQRRIPNGNGNGSVTDLDSEQLFEKEVTAWFRRGFDAPLAKGGDTEKDVAERTHQETMPVILQKDGLPVVNATDTFQSFSDVASRKSTRKHPLAEIDDATSSPTLQEAAETPVPAISNSNVKEGEPDTKDVAKTKDGVSPRKISFLDKIRGKITVLSGKLGNNQGKIMEGKKMMGKVV